MKIQPVSRTELWLSQFVLYIAILLQLAAWVINPELTYGPHHLILVTEVVLSVSIFFMAGSGALQKHSFYRILTYVLLGLVTLANISSFFLMSRLLITDGLTLDGRELLVAALAIFVTNIIVFSLWYWEIDSPGLSGKKWSINNRDFQFTQQDMSHEYPEWQPKFVDYIYLSLTNAINFAPADARPLSHGAKSLMGIQSLVSVFTLALIFARSVSILG